MDMIGLMNENPFRTLGASAQDDKHRLIALADEAALFGTEGAEDALTCLLNSQRRLDAEIAWFPGMSAQQAQAVIDYAEKNALAPFPDLTGAGALARLNACFVLLQTWDLTDEDAGCAMCLSCAAAADAVQPGAVMEELNDCRRKAGIQLITDSAAVADRLNAARSAMVQRLLERLSAMKAEQMHLAVDAAAAQYEHTRSRLIDALVSAYTLRAGEQIRCAEDDLIAQCATLAQKKEHLERIMLYRYVKTQLTNWGTATRPLRRIEAAKGIVDGRREALFLALFNFAAELYNQHRLLELSMELMTELDTYFGTQPDAKAQVLKALDQLRHYLKMQNEVRRLLS